MQIFALTNNPEFHALLEVEVREATGERPVVRSSIEDLQSLLGIFQTIDLLIADVPEDPVTRMQLEAFFSSAGDKIKNTFVLGELALDLPNFKCFKHSEMLHLFEDLKKTAVGNSGDQKWSYTAIPVSTLIHFESLPFDLYIKLSDNKYVKRIPAFEKIDREVIDSFVSKKMDSLYCDRSFNRDFSMMLINNMINKIDKSYGSVGEKVKANEEVFQTTKEIIQNLGMAGRVVEVCDAAIEQMCQDVLSRADEFSLHLDALKNDKSLGFQYRLIALTNYIGTQLVIDMNLRNGDEQIKKLIFASFFCDMTLKDPAWIYLRKEEETIDLDPESLKQVNYHALNSSLLVSNSKVVSKEVSMIIQQHHGSFSGIGFPKEKSSQLLPLSKILIVSQELAYAILADEKTPAMEILKSFLVRNKCQGLQELLDCLEVNAQKRLKETA